MGETMELRELGPGDVARAAGLFARVFRSARRRIPVLPGRYEDPGVVEPLLAGMVGQRPGVAAFRGGRMLGYLAAGVIPDWRGCRTAFAPFWAHAVAGEERARTMEEMYAFLSARWAEDNCTTHLVSVPAWVNEVRDALFQFGHGVAVIDAMRPLGPVAGSRAEVRIRRAGPGDRPSWHRFRQGLIEYLSGPPVLMHVPADKPDEYYDRWLGDSGHAVWLAEDDSGPVGYMQLCRLDEEVVVTDERTAGIEGAYILPGRRGQGIGAALLNRCLEWAAERGFERCAVDFEGENALGRRFWLRHFEPVLYALARRLDPRAIGRG